MQEASCIRHARSGEAGLIRHEEIEFAATLAEATRDLAGESDIDRALTLIIDLATESIVCEGASVTLRLAAGEFRTLAPTDLRVRKADQLQYELHEGPCVSATFDEGVFLVDELRATPAGRTGDRSPPNSVSRAS